MEGDRGLDDRLCLCTLNLNLRCEMIERAATFCLFRYTLYNQKLPNIPLPSQ